MSYNLICVHPFGNYEKGQVVTDEGEISALMANDRGQNFVRIAAPEVEENAPAVTAPAAPATPSLATSLAKPSSVPEK